MQWLQDGLLHGIGEEGVLVRRLEAPDQRVELLPLAQGPVQEAEAAVGDLDGTGLVDGAIKGKLDSLDEVEGDSVF